MKILLGILLIAGFACINKSEKDNIKKDSDEMNTSGSYIEFINSKHEWTEKKLSEMTLREKAAQMIISHSKGYAGEESSSQYQKLKGLVANEKIGGVIFFQGKATEEAALINKLQEISETPLLISADFERGTKMRLDDGSLFPNNMAIGAAGNEELAYKMGLQIAKECRAIGVHQNYSPVLDVNNNADNPIINVRSFGEDPQLVSRMGNAMIKGLQDGKVLATGKHFPGHGDTDIDSHSDLPVLPFDRKRLDNVELIPFKSAIENDVMSIMIAHLSFPALESEQHVASSLSPAIVTGLLKNDLKYKGLIVTDALNMAGITKHFSNADVAYRCAAAGIDLILMPGNESEAITTIVNAVQSGKISEDRINESARKILNAKLWLGLENNSIVDISKISEVVNNTEAQQISQQIADESLTLVTNNNNILPVKDASDRSVMIISLNNGKDAANSGFFFNRFNIDNKFKTVSTKDISGDISNVDALVSEASGSDIIIIPIYARVRINTGTVGIPESHSRLINNLISNGKKVVVVSFGNPYLLKAFPEADAYVAAYGDSDSSISAFIKALYGEIRFKGKLPVTISPKFPFGTGIQN